MVFVRAIGWTLVVLALVILGFDALLALGLTSAQLAFGQADFEQALGSVDADLRAANETLSALYERIEEERAAVGEIEDMSTTILPSLAAASPW